ncbi:hypothetical protein E4U54_000855 [Claviceps lovelessii]|nr:hypothetical protein E4U54_000855 [Claviceps lovelessii]
MLYSVGIGISTGFIFLSGLLFRVHSIEDIFMDATRSKAGSICLAIYPLLSILFTTVILIFTSTRMSYAFARGRGMPFSSFFARVHPTLEVPLNALL